MPVTGYTEQPTSTNVLCCMGAPYSASHGVQVENTMKIVEYLQRTDKEGDLKPLIEHLKNTSTDDGDSRVLVSHETHAVVRSAARRSRVSSLFETGHWPSGLPMQPPPAPQSSSIYPSLQGMSSVSSMPTDPMTKLGLPTNTYNTDNFAYESKMLDVARKQLYPTFESGEHDSLGDSAANVANELTLIPLPCGMRLSFGKIVALAGDFYGIPDTPICLEKTGTTPESRFMAFYNTLFGDSSPALKKELTQLLAIMDIEENSVNTVLGRGDPSIPTILDKNKVYNQPSDVYREHGLWFTIQYDTILGGKWVAGVPVIFGRMMKLAANNPDHFQPYSKTTWKVGYGLAVKKAREAGRTYELHNDQGRKLLLEAYSLTAFSCHFLTDSYSAGHIRVPRTELPACVTPSNVGDLLVHCQHDEDGKFGINVRNNRGNQWTCYGDGTLFDLSRSATNRAAVENSVLLCVEQIWATCMSPMSDPYIKMILDHVPDVDPTQPNNYPLFSVRSDGSVLRRKNVEDLSDARTVSNWWGWTTYKMLHGYKPVNSSV